jgi:hypothetical protein
MMYGSIHNTYSVECWTPIFWCEATRCHKGWLLCFWVGPINLESNTSRRIQYMMWCYDALSHVTTSLAASGLSFRSCVPNEGISFALTPRSLEWRATELDVLIPKKGGSGPGTCIFGVWDVLIEQSNHNRLQWRSREVGCTSNSPLNCH